ncbi:MAG: hypothetical protein WC759_01920 [Candidatus Micrarchaeia archaeon]
MAAVVTGGDQPSRSPTTRGNIGSSIVGAFSNLFSRKHNPETPQLLAQQSEQLGLAAKTQRKLTLPDIKRALENYKELPVFEHAEVEGRFSKLMTFLDLISKMKKDSTAANEPYFEETETALHAAIAHLLGHIGFDVVADVLLVSLSKQQLKDLQVIIAPLMIKPSGDLSLKPDQLYQVSGLIRSRLLSYDDIVRDQIPGRNSTSRDEASPKPAKGFRNAAGAVLAIAEIVDYLAAQEKQDDRAYITDALAKLFNDYPLETILEVRDIVAARSKNPENGNRYLYLPILNSINVRLAEMSRASGNGKSNGTGADHASTGNGHAGATGSMQAGGN